MKRVLIPSNLSPEALVVLNDVSEYVQDDQLEIIFGVGYRLNNTRFELYGFHPNRILSSAFGSDFKYYLEFQRRNNPVIQSVKFDLFTGQTKYAFQNFLKLHKIDLALVSRDTDLNYGNKFFDITNFIDRSGLPVMEINSLSHLLLENKLEQQTVMA
ncbi:MAG: hypothetical protein KDC53_16145 [Saprospiraceae bacterium]|nr:hypothetical protein [Saprospiraceae bacterium]